MTMLELMTENDIAIRADFVPFSQSRNAPDNRSLNWRVTLVYRGRDVLTTDYSAGIAHCPSYKYSAKWTNDYHAAIISETETGRSAKPGRAGRINPSAVDVLASLIIDADVLNYGSFEEWASEFGYDLDSRSAEKAYRDCLDIALKLKATFPTAVMTVLTEAALEI